MKKTENLSRIIASVMMLTLGAVSINDVEAMKMPVSAPKSIRFNDKSRVFLCVPIMIAEGLKAAKEAEDLRIRQERDREKRRGLVDELEKRKMSPDFYQTGFQRKCFGLLNDWSRDMLRLSLEERSQFGTDNPYLQRRILNALIELHDMSIDESFSDIIDILHLDLHREVKIRPAVLPDTLEDKELLLIPVQVAEGLRKDEFSSKFEAIGLLNPWCCAMLTLSDTGRSHFGTDNNHLQREILQALKEVRDILGTTARYYAPVHTPSYDGAPPPNPLLWEKGFTFDEIIATLRLNLGNEATRVTKVKPEKREIYQGPDPLGLIDPKTGYWKTIIDDDELLLTPIRVAEVLKVDKKRKDPSCLKECMKLLDQWQKALMVLRQDKQGDLGTEDPNLREQIVQALQTLRDILKIDEDPLLMQNLPPKEKRNLSYYEVYSIVKAITELFSWRVEHKGVPLMWRDDVELPPNPAFPTIKKPMEKAEEKKEDENSKENTKKYPADHKPRPSVTFNLPDTLTDEAVKIPLQVAGKIEDERKAGTKFSRTFFNECIYSLNEWCDAMLHLSNRGRKQFGTEDPVVQRLIYHALLELSKVPDIDRRFLKHKPFSEILRVLDIQLPEPGIVDFPEADIDDFGPEPEPRPAGRGKRADGVMRVEPKPAGSHGKKTAVASSERKRTASKASLTMTATASPKRKGATKSGAKSARPPKTPDRAALTPEQRDLLKVHEGIIDQLRHKKNRTENIESAVGRLNEWCDELSRNPDVVAIIQSDRNIRERLAYLSRFPHDSRIRDAVVSICEMFEIELPKEKE